MNIYHTVASIRFILDAIPLPIAIIDTSGHFVYYNEESSKIDGTNHKSMINKDILDVYPNINAKNSTMLNSALLGVSYENERNNYINCNGHEVEYTHSTKPIKSPEGVLVGSIEIGTKYKIIRKKNSHIDPVNDDKFSDKIIYQSQAMQVAIDSTINMAKKDIPIMIYGETGTGKELFAGLIHESSSRSDKPFVALNCGSIPEHLIEGLLFGTKKGAFTGALDKRGFIEKAEGGTLFLDELNSLPIHLQPTLLRYLQDGTYWNLGGDNEQKSNVRIIVAINEEPNELVRLGKLRQDLFYRLCIGYIAIPALRDRIEDIPVLVEAFIKKHKNTLNHKLTSCSKPALELLKDQQWNGNVRMLENLIIRSIIKQEAPGELKISSIQSLSNSFKKNPHNINNKRESDGFKIAATNKHSETEFIPSDGLANAVGNYEKKIIEQSFIKNRYCLSKTARELKINRSTLQYKIQKYNL